MVYAPTGQLDNWIVVFTMRTKAGSDIPGFRRIIRNVPEEVAREMARKHGMEHNRRTTEVEIAPSQIYRVDIVDNMIDVDHLPRIY